MSLVMQQKVIDKLVSKFNMINLNQQKAFACDEWFDMNAALSNQLWQMSNVQ